MKLIIHPGKSRHFSAGADIRLFYDSINNKNFKAIEDIIDLGQQAMLTLKYANIDVISCAYGLALGGGCELLLHSHSVVAHQNLNAGLVELGVGLIPGWGGVKEMFLRSDGNKNLLVKNLENILVQYQSPSSDYFAEQYNVECSFNMSIDNIIVEALELHSTTSRVVTNNVNLPKITLESEVKTTNLDNVAQDVLIFFQKIIDIGRVDESTLLAMEKEKFLQMAAKPQSFERISRLLSK